ncbi:MAG: radical SAM protein, partial [Candidatus Omnitrophota bacterium]
GNLTLSKEGIAETGLMIRLLMLPNGISGTEKTLEFISEALGKDAAVSVMSQYYTAHKALEHKELSRRISRSEYDKVSEKVKDLAFTNGWIQPFEGEFDPSLRGESF